MSDSTPKPGPGRPRKMMDNDLRNIAMQAYWRTDPADVSVNAICKAAGVSKPSLYRAFGNEDGLTLAALDGYADQVLSDLFTILQSGRGLQPTLDALVDFACADPRMDTGCLFYKMRAGRHRLGPQTRARVDEIDAEGQAAYAAFLEACCAAGEGSGRLPADAGAKYLSEQIALAFTQRASGEDPARIRAMLTVALSVLT